MGKRGHIDEMKARRQLKAAQEAEAARVSTLEPPDPARMAMQSDYILVRKLDKTRTESGLHIPEGATTSSIGDGIVVSAGPGQWSQGVSKIELVPMPCKVGDEIMLDPQAPAYGMPADRMLFATRACFVMAVVKPKPVLVE
jgi:co-chaperonin GroES (HSP10)